MADVRKSTFMSATSNRKTYSNASQGCAKQTAPRDSHGIELLRGQTKKGSSHDELHDVSATCASAADDLRIAEELRLAIMKV